MLGTLFYYSCVTRGEGIRPKLSRAVVPQHQLWKKKKPPGKMSKKASIITITRRLEKFFLVDFYSVIDSEHYCSIVIMALLLFTKALIGG